MIHSGLYQQDYGSACEMTMPALYNSILCRQKLQNRGKEAKFDIEKWAMYGPYGFASKSQMMVDQVNTTSRSRVGAEPCSD